VSREEAEESACDEPCAWFKVGVVEARKHFIKHIQGLFEGWYLSGSTARSEKGSL
jgi:hypothetical protein